MLEIRMTEELFQSIHHDLDRQHGFALERVGFVFGRLSPSGRAYLDCYRPVSDEQYIDSDKFGALIDDRAILKAMQETRHRRGQRACCFHVHRHEHLGVPSFSRSDLRSLLGLVPDLHRMDSEGASGLLLLSLDQALAWAKLGVSENPELAVATKVVVVGQRLRIFATED